MITAESIGFFQSFMTSLLGITIVFLSLVFLALFVTVVTKIIGVLESRVLTQSAKNASGATVGASGMAASGSEAIKVAVIAAALTEDRHEPAGRFMITNIRKM